MTGKQKNGKPAGEAGPKTNEGSEQMNAKHWIHDKKARASFWAYAKADLGLAEADAHTALNVEHVEDYPGTLDDAMHTLYEYAAGRNEPTPGAETNEQAPSEQAQAPVDLAATVRGLPESPALAWTQFQKGPGKPSWTLSLRAGLNPDEADAALREILREIANVEKWLDANGYMPVYDGRSQAGIQVRSNGNCKPAPATPASPLPPLGPSPAVPAPAIPGQPPAPATPISPGLQPGTQQELIAAKLSVEARADGKATLKFYAAGHKFPDLTVVRTPTELAALMAPTGAWTADHFAAATEYQHGCIVTYVLSAKLNTQGKPYKDVIAVRPT